MKKADEMVIIIDDDTSMRQAIQTLIETVGLNSQTYGSGEEFLQGPPPDVPSCLVLDVRLPGLSGLNLQHELSGRGMNVPIIFITAYGDIPMSVRAMKAGAVEFLTKPFRDQDLLDAIEQALQRDPNSAEAMQALAASSVMQKQPPAKMIARLKAQIAKSPNNSAFYGLLGTLEAQTHDFASAEQHLKKALELDKNNAGAFGVLAQVQFASGASEQAVATYKNWIQQNPKDVRPYVLLGTLQDMKNEWQEAQQMYQKALEVSPDFPLAANNLAYSMLEHGGNTDVALSLAQTARRGMPDSPNAADTLAYAYIKKGVYGSAIDLLKEAVTKSPQSATYQYHLGLAYKGNNDSNQAREHLQKALQIDPKFPAADEARKALNELKG